jgi:hypothetical protein
VKLNSEDHMRIEEYMRKILTPPAWVLRNDCHEACGSPRNGTPAYRKYQARWKAECKRRGTNHDDIPG